ncbi:MAG: low molecular weight phosphatase family protein [Thermoguttaceae bacterium]|jgi:protein-tyrosine phosphatase
MKQVLFLCSANYYRSRFAEHLFNWLAARSGLPWQADSRGLRTGHWGNIGPISQYAVEGLKMRGIPINGEHRQPMLLTLADLAGSDLVIALKEAEHRAMMAELFPLWTDQVEYWHVDDLDCAGPDEALPVLEEHVRALVDRLSGPPTMASCFDRASPSPPNPSPTRGEGSN